jgi:pyruvate,water dikinase
VTGTSYSRALAELRRADEPSFGAKSTSLGELLAAEIPVPPGFALSTVAFDAFVDQSGLRDTIASALASVTAADLDAVNGASGAIGDAMRAADMPEVVRDEVQRMYGSLHTDGDQPAPVAVRSSALGEDSADATFAGQQETYLWVRGADQVCQAVRDCWISLYSPTAISYRARLADADADAGAGAREPAMGVAVQAMVDAEVSGVMFTCNPVSGDPSMVAINASWGLGLAVVGGEVTPDDYLVSKVTREVVRAKVNDKQLQYVSDPAGHGVLRVDVPDDRRTARCLDDDALGALVEIAKRVERHFGSHQDIEWALGRRGSPRSPSEHLYLLQSRPVTAIAKPEPKPAPKSALDLVMATFGADAGKRRPPAQ